jgi:hypothetical protein
MVYESHRAYIDAACDWFVTAPFWRQQKETYLGVRLRNRVMRRCNIGKITMKGKP